MVRFILILFLLFTPLLSLSAQSLEDGSLVRCPDFSSVYYLADGQRWVFPNDKTYFTWYKDFEDVQVISCEELSDYEIGEVVTYQPGTRLLKLQGSPTVYAIEPGGVLRAIPSEEDAIFLYGEDWADRVHDLPDGFFSAYSLEEPLLPTEIPMGSVVEIVDSDSAETRFYYQGDASLYDVTQWLDEVVQAWALMNVELDVGDALSMVEEDWSELKDLSWREEEQEESGWSDRVDAAFAETDCEVETRTYPEGYYAGPLIDSHLHIANIPDASLDTTQEELEEEAGDRPSLGVNITMTEIACVFQKEGTQSAISFFPVYPDVDGLPEAMVEVAERTMELYPDLFIPFIMPPDDDGSPDGFPTVDADTLEEMLSFSPELFVGYGEIGLYAREGGAPELLPDSERLLEIYPIIEGQSMGVYFHPGENMDDNLAQVLEAYPTINFLVHGDQIQPDIVELMDDYDNIYFTMNDLYGDVWILRSDVGKESFLEYFDDFDELIEQDHDLYGEMIEAHPDRFMWGTDRGGEALWTYDVEVGQMLADYGRAFIGSLDPDIQENFAYKNALRFLGEE